jgi:hypothetical protein
LREISNPEAIEAVKQATSLRWAGPSTETGFSPHGTLSLTLPTWLAKSI